MKRNVFLTSAFSAGKAISWMVFALGLVGSAAALLATDLTIHLAGAASISRKTVQYQCDSAGTKIGVPGGPFAVEYVNGGGNSLAIVPVAGSSLIFSNVSAGSGARYTAQQYTWWEAGGAVTLSSDSLAGKAYSTCKPIGK
jgi:membrane-bound inhibitor of C-type lysozyme